MSTPKPCEFGCTKLEMVLNFAGEAGSCDIFMQAKTPPDICWVLSDLTKPEGVSFLRSPKSLG